MNNILWFREISDLNLGQVGNKAIVISKIFNNNIPVPNGFCITNEVFSIFQNETGIKERIDELLSNLDTNNINSLYNISEKIQNLILNSIMPSKIKNGIIESYENISVNIDVYKLAGKQALEIIKAGRETSYVAVRTSVLDNNVNHQPNIFNVKGKEELIKTIQKCWASIFTPNSLNLKLKNKISLNYCDMCIIIQKMIDADKSGIIYTINPEKNNINEIVIEACFGQGEVLTTGAIIPDKYIVNRENLELKEKFVNKQDFMFVKDDNIGKNVKKNIFKEEQKLDNDEINKIIFYALEIEKVYNEPQEIEFCINKDKIFILQAKPLVSFAKHGREYVDEFEEELRKKEHNILVRGLNASLGIRSGTVNLINSSEDLLNIKENQILVLKSFNDINLNFLDNDEIRKVSGIVTDNDNIDSPLAKLAREFGIPCIVGTADSTRTLKQEQYVTIDGNTGVIFEEKEFKKKVDKIIDYYNTATEVKVLIDNDNILPDSDKNDGIGILKINLNDFDFNLNREELITKISSEIQNKTEFFKNKPIWYYVNYNLDNLDFIKIQFEGIKTLQDKGITNIGISVSGIIDISQLKKVKEILREIKIEPLEEIEFGIIIDTIAASILIKEICEEEIDFAIIDLVKLTNATLNNLEPNYNEMHQAVLRQVSNIIKTCKRMNIETSIIGKNVNENEYVEFLIKNGIDSIICNVNLINETKNKIAKSEKKLILKAVRNELSK